MADKANLILEASKVFIRGYEQDPKTQDFVPQAHQPIVGDRWTLGWGSTRGVQEGDTVTREEAERLFERDIQSAISDFNSTISQEIRAELGVNESAAVVSFLFNHGNTKRWRDSKARGHLNKLEIPQFIYELTDPVQGFVKAGEPGEKEIVDGLVNRRAAERKLFNAPDVDIGAGIGALSVNGLNQGGIASFRPMGAVPTGVGMPMHMPRPPRGQMPPPGMRRGGIVGYQNRGFVDDPDADIEEVITDNPRIQFEALHANDDEEMRFRALVQELEHYRELASRSGHSIEEIISNRRAQGSLDPTAASNMLYMLETLRQQFDPGETGGPFLSPPEPAPSFPQFESPEVQDIGYGGNKEEWARKRAEAAALHDRQSQLRGAVGFQGGGVVTPFGMSLADTAEMASFASLQQASANAANGDLRGGIMGGQDAGGLAGLGALSRQEFGTGRSLLPSFTTEERGMPGVEGHDPWQVERSLYNRGGLTGQANKVAGAGRYGDTELVHMNPAEVQGLASLVPMTVNPETGKPEAFLGMLLGVLGNYLAGTGMMAGVAGALGTSGIGSLLGSVITNPAIMGAIGSGGGTWAETGDLEKGILSGMLSFGVGDALQKTGATSEGFLGSGLEGVGDPTAAGRDATALALNQGVAKQLAPGAMGPPLSTGPLTELAANKFGAEVAANQAASNQAIFNQQPFGTRLGQSGSNLLSKEGINAFTNPMNLSMMSTGASGLGAIRAEEQYAAWHEQQEEEKKRKRARMMGMPENIPPGVRQRFGLPAGGG